MLLLLKSKSRKISACRLRIFFSLRCTRSRQWLCSEWKASASPTWLQCAARQLPLIWSLSAYRLSSPSPINLCQHHPALQPLLYILLSLPSLMPWKHSPYLNMVFDLPLSYIYLPIRFTVSYIFYTQSLHMCSSYRPTFYLFSHCLYASCSSHHVFQIASIAISQYDSSTLTFKNHLPLDSSVISFQ